MKILICVTVLEMRITQNRIRHFKISYDVEEHMLCYRYRYISNEMLSRIGVNI